MYCQQDVLCLLNLHKVYRLKLARSGFPNWYIQVRQQTEKRLKESTSEQSSVCEGTGYDEVFQSCHELEKGLSWSSKRETSAYSPDKEVESCDVEGGEEE